MMFQMCSFSIAIFFYILHVECKRDDVLARARLSPIENTANAYKWSHVIYIEHSGNFNRFFFLRIHTNWIDVHSRILKFPQKFLAISHTFIAPIIHVNRRKLLNFIISTFQINNLLLIKPQIQRFFCNCYIQMKFFFTHFTILQRKPKTLFRSKSLSATASGAANVPQWVNSTQLSVQPKVICAFIRF